MSNMNVTSSLCAKIIIFFISNVMVLSLELIPSACVYFPRVNFSRVRVFINVFVCRCTTSERAVWNLRKDGAIIINLYQ